MWWKLAVVVLLLAVVGLPALAHASATDPSWIAGFWDNADYDDVVLAVSGLTAVSDPTPDVVPKPLLGVGSVSVPKVGVARSAPRSPSLTRSPPSV